MPEMSKSEEAAFAAMANEEQAAPATAEPEPSEQEEPEAAAAPSESEAGEPQEGAEDEGQAKPAAERRVPYNAFHEERTRRQQLEAENRRLSEERARFDERLRVIQEMNQPAPSEKPDWTVDPIGAGVRLEQEVERLKQGGQQWSEQQRQQAQVAQLARAAAQDATAFRSQTPDYADAFQFWGQSRANELLAYGVPAEHIPATLENEQLDLAANAYQRGVSPAETLYRIAQQRGFKSGAGLSEGNGADNGHAAAERIQRVATGQQRSQSLSGTGGGAAPVAMTVPMLLSLSNDEFAEWTEKNPRKTARLLGQEPPPRRRA